MTKCLSSSDPLANRLFKSASIDNFTSTLTHRRNTTRLSSRQNDNGSMGFR